MDAETIRWVGLAAMILLAGGSIYDRLGTLHDKAMRARVDHDRQLLEKLDAIERRLQAISGETHALPERIRGGARS